MADASPSGQMHRGGQWRKAAEAAELTDWYNDG